MRKFLSILLVATMLLATLALGVSAQSVNMSDSVPRITEPDYHKLDPELVSDLKANSEPVVGKQFKGKSYIKPSQSNAINPLDVRTKDAKSIAILVDFPTKEDGTSAVPGVNYPQVPAQKFNDLLNATEYNPFDLPVFEWLAEYKGVPVPTDRTLRNYYTEVSYDQYQIDVEVVDWVTLSHPYEYYLGQDQGYFANENGDARMGDLVLEAVKLADETVDFSQYAVDGEVPGIFIIHRGTGAEYNLDPEVIWSHKWDILSARYYGYYYRTGEYLPDTDETINALLAEQVVDNVIVNTYNIVPEVGRDITGYYYGTPQKPMPAYAGVYAHEFGHVLGLPDQYDYGYQSEGTGMYTLMSSGSYGNDLYDRTDTSRQYAWYSGLTPTHIDGWSKWYLGFAEPTVITENQSITLRPVSVAPDLFKIVVPGSNSREYFMLENRQQTNFDSGLAYTVGGKDTHGLLVYHVVDDMIQKRFGRPNEAENWDTNHLGLSQQAMSRYGQTHYGFSVIQADGLYDMEKYKNDGDSGDLFPGKYNVTSLSSKSSNPANTTSVFKWDTKSTETGINLENIVEHEDGTITLDVVFTK